MALSKVCRQSWGLGRDPSRQQTQHVQRAWCVVGFQFWVWEEAGACGNSEEEVVWVCSRVVGDPGGGRSAQCHCFCYTHWWHEGAMAWARARRHKSGPALPWPPIQVVFTRPLCSQPVQCGLEDPGPAAG